MERSIINDHVRLKAFPVQSSFSADTPFIAVTLPNASLSIANEPGVFNTQEVKLVMKSARKIQNMKLR